MIISPAYVIMLKSVDGQPPVGGAGVGEMVVCEDSTLALTPARTPAAVRAAVSANGTSFGTRGGLPSTQGSAPRADSRRCGAEGWR